MIDQVGTPRINGNNPFAEFKRNPRGYYFITPETQQDIFESSQPKPENEKKKRKFTLGATIGASALLVGFGLLALTKGMPKNTSKFLQKLSRKLEHKTTKDTNFNKFYDFSLRKVNAFIEKLNGVNNFTTIKDVWFKRNITDKTSWTKKLADKVTGLFERISRRTVNSSYNYTSKKFTNLFEHYGEINSRIRLADPKKAITIDGVTKTASEWTAIIENEMRPVSHGLRTHFGKNAVDARFGKMKHATRNLERDFVNETYGNVRNFGKKKVYYSFIAEEKLAGDKMALLNETGILRHGITHDIMDNYRAANSILNNISSIVKLNDKEGRLLLKKLSDKLVKYQKLSGPDEGKLRAVLNESIMGDLRALSKHIKTAESKYGYKFKTADDVAAGVNELEKVLCHSEKGRLQRIQTIYKHLLPRNEYIALKNETNQAIKALDKSIDVEVNQFFDKYRDLVLGSAPTDVLSILGAAGALGYGLVQADNKDERYSISLKYGIPAVGAIATSLYLTTSLVAGGKSMVAGFLSGLAMNWIGTKVDNVRKQYFGQKLPENTLAKL